MTNNLKRDHLTACYPANNNATWRPTKESVSSNMYQYQTTFVSNVHSH